MSRVPKDQSCFSSSRPRISGRIINCLIVAIYGGRRRGKVGDTTVWLTNKTGCSHKHYTGTSQYQDMSFKHQLYNAWKPWVLHKRLDWSVFTAAWSCLAKSSSDSAAINRFTTCTFDFRVSFELPVLFPQPKRISTGWNVMLINGCYCVCYVTFVDKNCEICMT